VRVRNVNSVPIERTVLTFGTNTVHNVNTI
jgi:hypothetical protein